MSLTIYPEYKVASASFSSSYDSNTYYINVSLNTSDYNSINGSNHSYNITSRRYLRITNNTPCTITVTIGDSAMSPVQPNSSATYTLSMLAPVTVDCKAVVPPEYIRETVYGLRS